MLSDFMSSCNFIRVAVKSCLSNIYNINVMLLLFNMSFLYAIIYIQKYKQNNVSLIL